MCIYLSVWRSIRPSIYLSNRSTVSVYLSLSLSLSLYISLSLSLCLSIDPSVRPSIHPPIHPSMCMWHNHNKHGDTQLVVGFLPLSQLRLHHPGPPKPMGGHTFSTAGAAMTIARRRLQFCKSTPAINRMFLSSFIPFGLFPTTKYTPHLLSAASPAMRIPTVVDLSLPKCGQKSARTCFHSNGSKVKHVQACTHGVLCCLNCHQ